MAWPRQSEQLVQREWVVHVGGTDAQVFRWSDAGGPVDLTDVGLTLSVEWPAYGTWPAGSFELACGEEPNGFWKLDQLNSRQKGMFAVRLSGGQRLLLPQGWPAEYSIWVERWGQRTKRWAGRIAAVAGAGTDG